jgi:hypothetical protein
MFLDRLVRGFAAGTVFHPALYGDR